MLRILLFIVCSSYMLTNSLLAQWNQWRGSASGNGVIANSDSQSMPMTWSDSENVLWKTPVPGVGYSSPIISNNKVILTTSEPKTGTQSLLCFDSASGEMLWKKQVHRGRFFSSNHKMNADASSTPVTDGKKIISLFGINDAIYASAHDFDGKEIWNIKLSDFKSQFGSGASPLYYNDMLVLPVENEPTIAVYGYDLSGTKKWTISRPLKKRNSWHTPRVFEIDKQPQLIFSGHNKLISYDPMTGKQNWSIPGGSAVTVGSVVMDGDIIYTSGGFPEKGTYAFDIKTKKLLWSSKVATYIPSIVAYNGRLFAATNNGRVFCLDGQSGQEIWSTSTKKSISSSLFVANDRLFIITEDGTTRVAKTDSKEYVELHSNKIPGLTRATPSIVGNRIYYRAENHLYCLAK